MRIARRDSPTSIRIPVFFLLSVTAAINSVIQVDHRYLLLKSNVCQRNATDVRCFCNRVIFEFIQMSSSDLYSSITITFRTLRSETKISIGEVGENKSSVNNSYLRSSTTVTFSKFVIFKYCSVIQLETFH